MLRDKAFRVLSFLASEESCCCTQRAIAEATSLSLGTVNALMKDFDAQGLVTSDQRLTAEGFEALEPFRVRNAVILAAGASSSFSAFASDRPKGLFKVRGEVLIERLIEQLQEAGIQDIYVVVGYKMDQFLYLEERYGVHIVANANYNQRNNNASIYAVRGVLGNSYICPCDSYFTENVFEKYVFESYYATAFFPEESREMYVKLDKHDRIIGTFRGGKGNWGLLGHCYLSAEFSEKYIGYLENTYDDLETKSAYWEWIFCPHLDEMVIRARKYEQGVIWEFDDLEEMREFDSAFLNNIDSSIMANIADTLGCGMTDIVSINRTSDIRSSLAFAFRLLSAEDERAYMYYECDPALTRAGEAARDLAAANGVAVIDTVTRPEHGYEIACVPPAAHPLEAGDKNDAHLAAEQMRTLHASKVQSTADGSWTPNVAASIQALRDAGWMGNEDFDNLYRAMTELNNHVAADGWQVSLCHRALRRESFLVSQQGCIVAEWGLAGNCDIGFDIARFCNVVAGGEGRCALPRKAVERYYGESVSDETFLHLQGCLALDEFAAYVRCIEEARAGRGGEEAMLGHYRNARRLGEAALTAYTA